MSDLRPARNQGTVGGYRELMLDQLFGGMLGERLDELGQSENPPFLRAGAQRGLFPIARTKDEADAPGARRATTASARGLDALLTELQRVAQFGFTESELARAKQAMMAGYERVVTESPDRESESRADEYTRNFLQDEALPTIWQELAFHRRFIPEVTLAEMNALARDWFPDRQPARRRLRARGRGRRPARSGAARRRRQDGVGEAARAYVDAGRRRRR